MTLVSFWATWCAPCLEELPIFAQLVKTYKGRLKIIAINQDDDPEVKPQIDQLWQKHRIPFKTYYDPGGNLARLVDLEVLPSNYVLDHDGRLAFSSFGAFNWSGENAKAFLAELLSSKSE